MALNEKAKACLMGVGLSFSSVFAILGPYWTIGTAVSASGWYHPIMDIGAFLLPVVGAISYLLPLIYWFRRKNNSALIGSLLGGVLAFLLLFFLVFALSCSQGACEL